MTLEDIKAMFQPGQEWEAVNTHMPKASGVRKVVQVLTTQMVWANHLGPKFWMQFPKASQVIEARDGFLKFDLYEAGAKFRPDHETTVTLTRMEAK